LLKNNGTENDFECESYALLKKYINGNQRATWKIEIGPRGDTPPSNDLNFTNKLLMK
jgi:hypothetical protein